MSRVPVGISMDEELLDEIDAGLEFGDKRSERAVELIELGLAVEAAAESVGWPIPDERQSRRAMIRQAFLDADRWQAEQYGDGR